MTRQFKIGDKVYWVINTWKKAVIERAGEIVAVVASNTSPNSYGFDKVVSTKMSLRNTESYLIKLPNSTHIVWVSVIDHLPPEKYDLLLTQKPLTVKNTSIDVRDRLKLKKVCKSLDAEFTESPLHINVLDWNKRFVFSVLAGIEYVSSIENIKFQ